MNIVALEDSHATKRPESWKVMKELCAAGLGRLPADQLVPAGLNADEFQKFLWDRFPRLQGIPLTFKRCNHKGLLVDLPAGTEPTPSGIKNRHRCLYLVPAQKIRDPQNICPTCGRTVTGDCIVCEQDREFEESLTADQQREQEVRARAHLSTRLTQLRSKRAEALAMVAEPQGGITVRCRLPNGSTIQRKFLIDDPVMNLLNWVGSTEAATKDFTLNIPGKPVLVVSSCTDESLLAIGIETSCLINVSWIEPQEEIASTIDTTSATPSVNSPCTSGTNVAIAPVTSQTTGRTIIAAPLSTCPSTNEAIITNDTTGIAASSVSSPSTSGTTSAAPMAIGSAGTPSVSFPLVLDPLDSDDDFDLTVPGFLDVCETTASEELTCPSPEMEQLSMDNFTNEYDWKAELKILQSQVSSDHVPSANCINAVRERVMDSAIRAFRRKKFDPLKKLNVMFVDDYGESEGAIDNGGPTREFLRLLLKEATTCSIFEGPKEALQLALSTEALSKNTYRTVGLIFALSLLHGGPAPACLSDNLFRRITQQETKASIDDVKDDSVKLVLQKIQDAKSIVEMNDEILKGQDILSIIGSVRYVTSEKQRNNLVTDSLNYYLFGRLQTAEEQLMQGLETGGLLKKIRERPQEFEHLFTYNELNAKLDHSAVEELFHPILSEAGSNHRRVENRIRSFWSDWLIEIEDGESEISFEDLLIFTTCLGAPPPLGFDTSPCIEFLHNGGKLPTANTCDLVLRLPIHDEYDHWKACVEHGIVEAKEVFGVK